MDNNGHPAQDRLTVPGTPQTNKFCAKCNLPFDKENPFFECSICLARVHVTCSAGKYSDAEIAKLKRAITPFFYACFNCTDKFQSGKLKATINNTERMAINHGKEMEKLKNLYELKANQMLTTIQQHETQLQETTRQLELTKIGIAGSSKQANKRARNEEDLNDGNLNDTFSGFNFTKEIAIEIVKQAVAPLIDTMQSFNRRLDEQAAMINEFRQNHQTQHLQFPQLPQTRAPTTPRNAPNLPTKSRLSKKDEAKINMLSYAQAVALAALPPQNIRNISIKGDNAEALKVATALRKDNLFAELPIAPITN